MGHGWSRLALLIVMVMLASIAKGIDGFLLHEVFQFYCCFDVLIGSIGTFLCLQHP
jgi:hypothetical protein